MWAPFSVAESGDAEAMDIIADAVETAYRAQRPLPTEEQMRRQLREGVAAHELPTVGECVDEWVATSRRVKSRYASHIRATLSKALNDAIRYGLITSNPATMIELPSGAAPKPMVWTPSSVHRWQETGDFPGEVMVWPPELTGQFLDHALGDELYALFHLVALRGLRRGEACGLPWTNVDLANAALTVDTQLVQYGWDVVTSDPKSQASKRIIPSTRGPSPCCGRTTSTKPRPKNVPGVPGPTAASCSPSPTVAPGTPPPEQT